MKRTIRLTESDLHMIIKESVNKVLNELDWRTYANAGKKAIDDVRGMMKSGLSLGDLLKDPSFSKRARQARNFRDQAVATSRDKFKYMNDDENEFYTTVGPDDTYYANVENNSWNGRPMTMGKDGKTRMEGMTSPKMVNVKPERYFGYNDDKVSDWNDFSDEINDYNSGKSEYEKGKGWR